MSKLILEGVSLQDFKEIISEIVQKQLKEILSRESQTSDNPIEDYLPRKELLKMFSAGTLWKYQKAGKLKQRVVGGKNFYAKKEVRELFEKHID